jgi:uncharacterized protein (TIGR02594 family)
MTAEPKWLTIAKEELGTKEVPGPRSNPGVEKYFTGAVGKKFSDSIPWCAAFVGWALVQANKRPSGSLMARSYVKWGKKCAPQTGAIMVMSRGRSPIYGHVTIVEHVGTNEVVCIGGNQSDAVTRQSYPKARAIAFRWPDEE